MYLVESMFRHLLLIIAVQSIMPRIDGLALAAVDANESLRKMKELYTEDNTLRHQKSEQS